jgi:3-oxoacyl-(acyl-carrier-protein) synthase
MSERDLEGLVAATTDDGRPLRWRVGHDDPLITDPATAPIMECIGLVMGELGDEPRAAQGYAKLRAYAADRDRLQAEVARLREALGHATEAISQCDCIMTHGTPGEYNPKREFWIARRALADREPAP